MGKSAGVLLSPERGAGRETVVVMAGRMRRRWRELGGGGREMEGREERGQAHCRYQSISL